MSSNPNNADVDFGNPSNAFDDNTQSVGVTGKLDHKDRDGAAARSANDDSTFSSLGGNDSSFPSSGAKDSAFSSSGGKDVFGSGTNDTFGTRQTGAGADTFGQDSLASGGLASGGLGDERRVGGSADYNPESFSSANDPSFGTAGNSTTGMNEAGGITGTSGTTGTSRLDSDSFAGTGAQPGAHSVGHTGHAGHSEGDSTMGKIIQKTGEVLKNPKLQQKGQAKREEKGYDATDVV